MVKILDCTTRDGGHETKWNFEDVFVNTLMEFLNKSNVSYYEIGYIWKIANELYNLMTPKDKKSIGWTPEFEKKFNEIIANKLHR